MLLPFGITFGGLVREMREHYMLDVLYFWVKNGVNIQPMNLHIKP